MACGSIVSFGANGEIVYDLAAKCRLPPGTVIVRERYETLLTVPCIGNPLNLAWCRWPNMHGSISVDNYGGVLLTVEGCKWYFVREVAFTPPELAAIICPIMTMAASGWKVHLSALPGWLPTSQPVHVTRTSFIPCTGSDCTSDLPLNSAASDCSSMRGFHFTFGDAHAGTDGFHLFRNKRTAIVADGATEGRLPQFRLLELDRMRCEAVEDMLKGHIMERVSLEMFEAWVASVSSLMASGAALADEVRTRIQAERARHGTEIDAIVNALKIYHGRVQLEYIRHSAEIDATIGTLTAPHAVRLSAARREGEVEADAAAARREADAAAARREAEADAARREAEAARREAEADAARREADAVVARCEADADAARREADAARREADAARREADAARREAEADAARREADSARREAEADAARRIAEVDAARRKAEADVAHLESEELLSKLSEAHSTNKVLEAELRSVQDSLLDAKLKINTLCEALERIKAAAVLV